MLRAFQFKENIMKTTTIGLTGTIIYHSKNRMFSSVSENAVRCFDKEVPDEEAFVELKIHDICFWMGRGNFSYAEKRLRELCEAAGNA